VAQPLLTTGPLSPFASLKQEQVEGVEEATLKVSGQRWGMVINLDKCIGCEYCLRACSATNDVWVDPELQRPEKPWNIVVKDNTSIGTPFFFSRPCLHCGDAPCVEVCPVQATYHREDGLVVMNYGRCIGCRYCEIACPYDARKFNWQARTDVNPYIPTWGIAEVERRPRGVVEKCTFCIHRIDAGLDRGFMPGEDLEATPACVNICPVGARIFGDLNDPNSNVSQAIASEATIRLREELGTEPSVYYVIPKEGL
jgi:molybdopterin-containing oxidoreductase family iron-sulfur binding subunit